MPFVCFNNSFFVRAFADELSVKMSLKDVLNVDYFLKIDVSFRKLIIVYFMNGNPVANYKGKEMMKAFFIGRIKMGIAPEKGFNGFVQRPGIVNHFRNQHF